MRKVVFARARAKRAVRGRRSAGNMVGDERFDILG
jgi:hypothetical protein